MIEITKIKLSVHGLLPDSVLDRELQNEPDSISETEFAILAPRWNRILSELLREGKNKVSGGTETLGNAGYAHEISATQI